MIWDMCLGSKVDIMEVKNKRERKKTMNRKGLRQIMKSAFFVKLYKPDFDISGLSPASPKEEKISNNNMPSPPSLRQKTYILCQR